MALWPFGKKNDSDVPVEAVTKDDLDTGQAQTPQSEQDVEALADRPDPEHNAIDGSTGPFDGDSVDISEFDFSDFSKGVLDLGSLQVPVPKTGEVQVEMGEQGPKMLHIVTEFGRLTPVAFAAPRSAGQWRAATTDIADGMRKDGLSVRIETGPWGREVVGEANDRQIRIAGVDGPRWMLRMTMISPTDRAENMRDLGREVIARTFVKRGDAPVLAGSPLPVALPAQLAQQVQQAMAQRAQQQKQAGNQSAPNQENH